MLQDISQFRISLLDAYQKMFEAVMSACACEESPRVLSVASPFILPKAAETSLCRNISDYLATPCAVNELLGGWNPLASAPRFDEKCTAGKEHDELAEDTHIEKKSLVEDHLA